MAIKAESVARWKVEPKSSVISPFEYHGPRLTTEDKKCEDIPIHLALLHVDASRETPPSLIGKIQHSSADIVTIQNVYSADPLHPVNSKESDIINDAALVALYPYRLSKIGAPYMGAQRRIVLGSSRVPKPKYPSGLVFLSKYEIDDVRFKVFDEKSNQGTLAATLLFKEKGKMNRCYAFVCSDMKRVTETKEFAKQLFAQNPQHAFLCNDPTMDLGIKELEKQKILQVKVEKNSISKTLAVLLTTQHAEGVGLREECMAMLRQLRAKL